MTLDDTPAPREEELLLHKGRVQSVHSTCAAEQVGRAFPGRLWHRTRFQLLNCAKEMSSLLIWLLPVNCDDCHGSIMGFITRLQCNCSSFYQQQQCVLGNWHIQLFPLLIPHVCKRTISAAVSSWILLWKDLNGIEEKKKQQRGDIKLALALMLCN